MQRIAESFSWPFRAPVSRWLPGMVCVLLLPLLFIPLLGYAVAATRAAAHDPPQAPPAWTASARLLTDGLWVAAAIALTALPFAALLLPLANALHGLGSVAGVVAFFVLALPWGLLALLVLPHATARYAAGGAKRDLFDFSASVRSVRREFATWNLTAAAIVTAWAIGLACVGLLCVGILPGAFYAILVSAHACAALAQAPGQRQGGDPPAR